MEQLGKAFLIFYLLLANNYTGDLLSKQMKNFIDNNRLIQHFIAFMMLFVIIIIIGSTNTLNSLLYSLFGYLLFIFTTKMDIHWNIIVLCVLFFWFFIDSQYNTHINLIENDQLLTDEQKNIVLKKRENNYLKYFMILILVMILGGAFYVDKKIGQYGGGKFDLATYLFY